MGLNIMKKIILIGSGGAGKSTLARQLGAALQIEVIHLDALFWNPNWTPVQREKQVEIQKELVNKEEWIIDGNYGGTIDIRLQAADTIIFLDIPRTICVYRAFKRMIQYRNKTRPDMGKDCNERLDINFLKWIWRYPKTKRPDIVKKLEGLSTEKQIIILQTPKQIQQFIENI